jgi:DNA replication protein DnaC
MVVGEVAGFVDAYPFPKNGKKGLFLQGPTGVGKTHLAVAALRRLAERGFDVAFFDYQTLLQRIRDSYNPAAGAGDHDAYQTALDAEILLLDDLGAHRATEWVTDTVTQIITHRYNEDKALIATSNLGLPEHGDMTRFRDAETGTYRVADTLADRIGDRAVSRLFLMCTPVRIRTQDYRRREVVAARPGLR